MKTKQKGFGVVEVLVTLVIVGLIGGAGWYAYQRNKTDDTQANTQTAEQSKTEDTKDEQKTDPNEGYLVVKEWGVRFKAPSSLTNVAYRISGDVAAFYAKPKGYTVTYRSDYEKMANADFPQYAPGRLYRSTESSKDKMGVAVEGKKIGDYYYYTSHAFSGLATGAGPTGLFFDDACEQDSSNAKCDPLIAAEQKVFQAMNQGDAALLNTIEAAK